MMKFEIKQDTVSAFLAALREKLKDLSPAMQQVAGIMHSAVEDNFAAQGRPAWKPSKRVLKKGGRTLQDTGRLASSIRPSHTKTDAIVGTNVIYAAIHQFGGKVTKPASRRTLAFKSTGGFMSRKAAGRRKTGATRVAFANYSDRTFTIPARPFLSLTDGDWADVKTKITEYLVK